MGEIAHYIVVTQIWVGPTLIQNIFISIEKTSVWHDIDNHTAFCKPVMEKSFLHVSDGIMFSQRPRRWLNIMPSLPGLMYHITQRQIMLLAIFANLEYIRHVHAYRSDYT